MGPDRVWNRNHRKKKGKKKELKGAGLFGSKRCMFYSDGISAYHADVEVERPWQIATAIYLATPRTSSNLVT